LAAILNVTGTVVTEGILPVTPDIAYSVKRDDTPVPMIAPEGNE
jgi:hypothetical protein